MDQMDSQSDPIMPTAVTRKDMVAFVKDADRASDYGRFAAHLLAGLRLEDSCRRSADAFDAEDDERGARRAAELRRVAEAFVEAEPESFLSDLLESAGYPLCAEERAIFSVRVAEATPLAVMAGLFKEARSVLQARLAR